MDTVTLYYNNVHMFLEAWGMWSILVLLMLKTVLGILVAIQKNEFKWFYLANVLKNDALKVVTLFLLQLATHATNTAGVGDVTVAGGGALLLADLTAGVVKNLAALLPSVGDNVPSSFREPARLRLGNPKNLG